MKKTLYIAEVKELESLEADITIKKAYCNNDWKINETDNDTYDSCIIEYKDTKLGKKVKGTATAPRVNYKKATGKVLKFKESFGVKGDSVEEINQQLNKIASGKLREKNTDELSISLTVIGNTELVAGRTIKLSGWGQYDEYKYVIVSAEHTLNNGYTVKIESRRCLDI